MPHVEQGGAVAVRTDSEQPQFLIVTARDNDDFWVFPKSELAEGEDPEDAAIRECLECGVEGEMSGRIGVSHFQAGNRDVEVTYFLIHLVNDGESTTGRKTTWMEYDAARERLTFDDAKEFLDKAAGYLTARG